VGASVGIAMETHDGHAMSARLSPTPILHLKLLGPLAIHRDGVALRLPASRKARALLVYLALSPGAPGRRHLCELLWEVPNDPRGELRWCLSKIRGLVDDADHPRLKAHDDQVSLDLSDCHVDAAEIAAALDKGLALLPLERLTALERLFTGEFLERLDIDRSPSFQAWLIAQRRRFRAANAALLQHLVGLLPATSDEIFAYLEKWIELAPFDRQPHLALLSALAERGRFAECDEHLAAAARRFAAEELDFAQIRMAWQAMKEERAAVRVSASQSPDPVAAEATRSHRVALAVMPFIDETGMTRPGGGLAHGLTHDIITRLAKLRAFSVIAQGSVFALAERGVASAEAAHKLDVDYVASGTLRQHGDRLAVAVDLAEARGQRIVWAEKFDYRLADALLLIDEIGNEIVSAIAGEIETAERNRAVLKAPNSLNAWEAYHRGLWHMYRFTKAENDQARQFFTTAIRLDPTFSRAYAGLSFTHWQSAFQRWADRAEDSRLALATADQGLIVDEHDPSVHWALGRALWLNRREADSLAALERTVDLSPSFALGHYALSFVQAQSGDPRMAIGSSDHSRRLSPFDPLLFAMLSSRALAHVRLGEFEEAAVWALKGAARPNAHPTITAIAAHCLALTGRVEEGRRLVATIRQTLPNYGFEDFRTTFHFPADTEALFRQAAERIGLI
jgi:DNA-binding SARP family transcriptional activator/tetratricopeptide (TPR) repeat protein